MELKFWKRPTRESEDIKSSRERAIEVARLALRPVETSIARPRPLTNLEIKHFLKLRDPQTNGSEEI